MVVVFEFSETGADYVGTVICVEGSEHHVKMLYNGFTEWEAGQDAQRMNFVDSRGQFERMKLDEKPEAWQQLNEELRSLVAQSDYTLPAS